jgi:shikimate dehydrogenase
VAAALSLPFLPLEDFHLAGFALVVHATSLGAADGDGLPFSLDGAGPELLLLDLVYRHDDPTPLVAEARRRGALAVDGREVLLYQGVEQFRLMTGHELSLELGRRVLGLEPAP